MTCDIYYPLWVQIDNKFWYLLKNKSHFMGILKICDPFIKNMTKIIIGLISNRKIDRTLDYNALNTFLM